MLLCFTIGFTTVSPVRAGVPVTAADIHRKYPGARVLHVSPEAYPALAATLSSKGYRPAGEQMALNSDDRYTGTAPVDGSGPALEDGDCADTPRDRRTGDVSLRLAVDATGDAISTRGRGGGDSVVLFVIVGTVVLVVWTLYAFKYLFDLAVGRRPCGTWSDLTASTGWASGDRKAYARFGGIRYRTGFRKGSTDVGISAEVGESRIELPDESLDLRGTYWLVGPLLRWQAGGGRNPHYFQMEFLAGSTENEEVGVLAQARVGLNFGVDEHFRWGLNVGALNINLDETEGMIRDRSQYHYLFGLEMGYRF